MDSCFGHFGPHQHDVANKEARVPTDEVISVSERIMFMGCGLKNYNHKMCKEHICVSTKFNPLLSALRPLW